MNKKRKAQARRQLKERWFDAGTVAYERVFPGERARDFPDIDNPYVCPLCRKPFPKAAIADNTLTFEDAPPVSYGGKRVALTCKPCNNSLGSSLDSPLSTLDSNVLSPCWLSVGGVEVIAYQDIGARGRNFQIPANQNDPTAVAQFNQNLEIVPGAEPAELQLTIKWDEVKRRRADLAWLKAAYILTFAQWGYNYVFLPALQVVREQLLSPDEAIVPKFKLLNREMPNSSRFMIVLRQPRELVGCLAVGMGQHVVLLPVNGRDMDAFKRIEAVITGNERITLVGDQYRWPTEPSHSLDIVAFDSRLILPTPGQVRLLA